MRKSAVYVILLLLVLVLSVGVSIFAMTNDSGAKEPEDSISGASTEPSKNMDSKGLRLSARMPLRISASRKEGFFAG